MNTREKPKKIPVPKLRQALLEKVEAWGRERSLGTSDALRALVERGLEPEPDEPPDLATFDAVFVTAENARLKEEIAELRRRLSDNPARFTAEGKPGRAPAAGVATSRPFSERAALPSLLGPKSPPGSKR